MLPLTEPSQWRRPPRPCPLGHTLAPRNLRESRAELLSAVALLDFKTFLVLGYLPVADSLAFCLSLSLVCVHFWIWLVFESVVFALFFFFKFHSCLHSGEGKRRAEQCSLHRDALFQTGFWAWSPFLIITCCLSRMSLCPERLGTDAAVVLRRALRVSPGRRLHKSALRLSLLYFNVGNNL